jgi:hypothetical protein
MTADEFGEWLRSELLHRWHWRVENSQLVHIPTGRKLSFWHDWTNPALKRRDRRNSVLFGIGPTAMLRRSEYRLIRDRAARLKLELCGLDYEELTKPEPKAYRKPTHSADAYRKGRGTTPPPLDQRPPAPGPPPPRKAEP